jgi:hypothetical protein
MPGRAPDRDRTASIEYGVPIGIEQEVRMRSMCVGAVIVAGLAIPAATRAQGGRGAAQGPQVVSGGRVGDALDGAKALDATLTAHGINHTFKIARHRPQEARRA